ncbi:glycosyltransferase family 2 protein [Shewanella sp. 1_MG-2023]|uniref:glycosyltransferase family 2 protein n=1 Tax=unclassified Shewanella TaxID=196818 RepID=UPI0026E3783C|nr:MULTISPECIES: glycosyltransferase family 2 protein [unclassified Shewanella]MDO6610115.1 glycosyltransferase family 2 protein [Shewanella sp. 7_MG-2023]MDO6769743.1 glycosyltransferase family 2 protein [Shewanella sp. 2_MG-2023]MDO6792807.1 glycosyltransferase family 2 protein [Shewanella sp. 1_MG-2023]
MEKNKSLTLAVSTMENGLHNAMEIFRSLPIEMYENVEVVIVCQGKLDKVVTYNSPVFCKVIFTNSLGLSKSRNIAIKNSRADHIWFLDDDVILKNDFIYSLIKNGLDKQFVYFCCIYCSDDKKFYKEYREPRINKLSLLKVSSVEIIAPTSVIFRENIKFDEHLGLGARYPSGEENDFLLKLFDVGVGFTETNEIGLFHPCHELKRDPRKLWMKNGYPESKGLLASRFGLLIGSALCLRWSYKALLNGVSIMNVLKMLKAFLK